MTLTLSFDLSIWKLTGIASYDLQRLANKLINISMKSFIWESKENWQKVLSLIMGERVDLQFDLSRSSKVNKFGAIWKPICKFLYDHPFLEVANCSRFRVINVWNFDLYPTLIRPLTADEGNDVTRKCCIWEDVELKCAHFDVRFKLIRLKYCFNLLKIVFITYLPL